MFRENLGKIIQKNDLSEAEMSQMITDIFSGDITDAQIGAFMAALATKGETFKELAGAAQAMRRKAQRIQASSPTVVDTCGTGGDGAKTFNISTTTAFVVAGCDVTVAKHGNRSISSQCGSADLLEALGVKIDLQPELVEEAVSEIGIGFMFAPVFHGAMKFAAKARKEIGLRSIFNMLGPLTNPAAANCQLLGVFAPELTEMFANALKLLGGKRAFVVHGHDGLDEISVCAPTRVSELNDGMVRTYDIDPEQFFGKLADSNDLKGGDPQMNANITKIILNGDPGPKRDVVVLNAAAALTAAGKSKDLKEGIGLAEESIDKGAAALKLDALIKFTQEIG
ncbi:MAG: anthranilate phosphoribosyltransferase [Deltaproteobacteria bacterium]|nr:anthranilate phosphoribosyltransferase [Deltaproteobacteria bacterium]MBW1848941.1 anthranilate phosphoribosyltransferase [Deltaproteobacteria bacterium]MBW2181523.1 anthranilate phosphoribosyltransferase [Deltaproteobacteria bacterium]MBW2364987.1 anthranilate phosphoribosyltransferase [Deltaproteobacteria bacterium]